MKWRSSYTGAGLLLTLHTAMLAGLAQRYSPTLDEVGHLPAGVAVWRYGRFDLYCVNPPLVRAVAALPVCAAGIDTDWSSWRDDPRIRSEWSVGVDFLHRNGARSHDLWTLARWACIPFSLVGGLSCFGWARELWGERAALGAVALWCFSPNVLGYGALITADLAAAALGIHSAWLFARWLRKPTWTRAVGAGLALGLALLSKLTWIILLPVLPLVWAATAMARSGRTHPQRQAFLQLMTLLLASLYLLNLGYAFDGSFTRVDQFTFYSKALSGSSSEDGGNRFRGTPLGAFPVPVPRDYLRGIDLQKFDFERGRWSFLNGVHRFGGWWYYHIVALAVTVPLGTWALLALSLWVHPTFAARTAALGDVICLIAPPLLLLAIVSFETGFTRYVRYVLPIMPFVFVFASRVLAMPGRRLRAAGVLLIVWSIASSAGLHPHSLSYANELMGGPLNGRFVLWSENFDWGQDLDELAEWVQRHPEARPLTVAAEPFFDPGGRLTFPKTPACSAGRPVPRGWHAISVGILQDREARYAGYEQLEPVDRVGYSILIYHVP